MRKNNVDCALTPKNGQWYTSPVDPTSGRRKRGTQEDGKMVNNVIRSDRYPGWNIRKNVNNTFTMTKGNAEIFVSSPDNGKTWRAWVDMGDPQFGQFDSVAEAIAALS